MNEMRKLMEAAEQLNESFQGQTYDAILDGSEATEEGALDYARGMVWSEVGTTENNIKYANHIGTENGVDVFYDFGADYYFFAPAELEEGFRHKEDSIPEQIKSLLAQNKRVVSKLGGAHGDIVDIEFDGPFAWAKLKDEGGISNLRVDDDPNLDLVGNIDHYALVANIEEATDDYGVEGWAEEETYDEMVDYWKQSLSSSIVQKGLFTQMYSAAGEDIDELNRAIEDEAHSIADTYHGSGEGIGTSDQNHFIASVASSLGIEDIFGWRKPKEESIMKSDDEMERDKTNRHAKYNKAERGNGGLDLATRSVERKRDNSPGYDPRTRFDTGEELDEAKGKVVSVPFKLRASSGPDVTAHASSQDAEDFIRQLGIDDQVSHDIVDPETGELLFTKNTTKRKESKKGNYQVLNYSDFTRGAKLRDPESPVMHSGWDGGDYERQQDDAWSLIHELRDNDFYNVVWKNAAELVGSPEDLGAGDQDWGDLDYDVDVEVPVAIKRKDGQRFTDDDHDNFREIVKAVKKTSTMGNFGIQYAGTSNKGTVARFVPSFM